MPSFAEDALLIDALMQDDALFEKLAGALTVYRRFAKVLLREDTASQLSLAEVAYMADVTPHDLLAAIGGGAAGGGAADGDATASGRRPTAAPLLSEARPDWLDGNPDLHRLDVRPLLENGHEPLADILAFARQAPPDCILAIDASFHPQPLRRLLGSRGYDSFAEPLAADHWRAYFRKAA